jgi:hypothetical protein
MTVEVVRDGLEIPQGRKQHGGLDLVHHGQFQKVNVWGMHVAVCHRYILNGAVLKLVGLPEGLRGSWGIWLSHHLVLCTGSYLCSEILQAIVAAWTLRHGKDWPGHMQCYC